MAANLRTIDLTTGWTPAHSLNEAEAQQTAEFIIYSALTCVARRPDVNWSWTENWPFEPEVGNVPTTEYLHLDLGDSFEFFAAAMSAYLLPAVPATTSIAAMTVAPSGPTKRSG